MTKGTMLLLLSLAALSLDFASGAADFDVTAHTFRSEDEFEFVYHNMHDLLLVVHDDKCYYGQLSHNRESTEDRMMDSDAYKSVIEFYLMRVIRDGHVAEHSNLNAMRDEFQDRLADYRCDGKDIYTFELEDHWKPLKVTFTQSAAASRPPGRPTWHNSGLKWLLLVFSGLFFLIILIM